ncbi:hypothetical protein IC582_004746 [Cucumis melo]
MKSMLFLLRIIDQRLSLSFPMSARVFLQLLDSNLIPSASASESKVFYLKMKGDYHRYLAEFKVGDERKAAAEDTMLAYRAAQDVAVADLAPTHPIRLGLALNFSVFYFEILNQSDKACSMDKEVSLILHVAFPLYILSLCFITDHREEWVDSSTLLLFSLGPPFVDLCHIVT